MRAATTHRLRDKTIGDVGLRAVEQPMVARVLGARFYAGQVRAGAGLGHRDRQDRIARDATGQPTCLLLLGGQVIQVRTDDAVVQGQEEP